MGRFDLFPGIEGLINDRPAAQVLELDLDAGLLGRPFLVEFQAAEELSADLNRHPGLYIIDGDRHSL